MERFEVDDVSIEYEVRGGGEPVLMIDPSLNADAVALPLLGQPELASHYQLIRYHRRGYMGSTLGTQPPTIYRNAKDAEALLRHLEVKSAHIVGHSFGGNIALQIAVDTPDMVHSLALLEPDIMVVQSFQESMKERVFPAIQAYQSGNKRQAVETLCNNVFGPNWQPIIERAIPGVTEQLVEDVGTFIQELMVNKDWQFEPQQASRIYQPVLSVVGRDSRSSSIETRKLLHTWFPQLEDLDVNANHMLQMQDPEGVAHGLAEFFARHPMKEGIDAGKQSIGNIAG